MTRAALIIAIDGPAGAGKSTIAKALATRFGLSVLDTGAIYRCVALVALERRIATDDDDALSAICLEIERDMRFEDGRRQRVLLGDRDVSGQIRTPEVSQVASLVSARSVVRNALLGIQRRLGEKGVVAEGRDMGTVVFPNAPVKIFLEASPEKRAQRRASELRAGGRDVTVEETLREQTQRDERDLSRAAAPLRRADDAVGVDTSEMTIEEVVVRVEKIVRSKR